MKKTEQIEVIKFLKSPEYREVLKKYQNKYENKMKTFETLYLSENSDYKGNNPEYSELALQAKKVKIFKSKVEDIKGVSIGASLMKDLLNVQIENTKTHLFNSVTNGMGLSKDTPIYTADDMEKYSILFEREFHLFIITLMNPSDDGIGLSIQDKYAIYDNPEENLD